MTYFSRALHLNHYASFLLHLQWGMLVLDAYFKLRGSMEGWRKKPLAWCRRKALLKKKIEIKLFLWRWVRGGMIGFPFWLFIIVLTFNWETWGKQSSLAGESPENVCVEERNVECTPRAARYLPDALWHPSRSHVEGQVVVIIPGDPKNVLLWNRD